jgi:signal transduction histidine kinase
MPQESLFRNRWQRLGVTLSIWTALGLTDAAQFYAHSNYNRLGQPVTWDVAIASGLADWYLWALLAPFIYLLGRRFPLGRNHWPRRVALYLAAGTVFALVKVAGEVPLYWLIHGKSDMVSPLFTEWLQSEFLRTYELFLTAKFFLSLFVFGSILVVSQFLVYYRKFRERELSASLLKAQLAQAQLQSLKMQLHPHFLFNTLNAVSALMHSDLELADRMIARLGDLMRATLEHDGQHEVSVRQELDFLLPYLEIEQARLGPRLAVRTEIDPEVLDARLPYLALQPLVENAIRHGISARSRGGRLLIQASRQNGRLSVHIRDDGPGLPDAVKPGIGLANTRARFEALYGGDHEFSVRNAEGGGVEVSLLLPFHTDALAQPASPGETP